MVVSENKKKIRQEIGELKRHNIGNSENRLMPMLYF
jgi:hypothetical protein